MGHRTTAMIVTALVALGACSSDGTDQTESSEPAGTLATDAPADSATTDSATDSSVGEVAVAVTTDAPDGASVVVVSDGATTDRTIRRGGQSAIEQGQTFPIAEDTTLTGVAFEVVAPDGVPAGTMIELALYEVGDVSAMKPSGPVPIGEADRVVLSLPDPIEPGVPTQVSFTFPAVPLTGPAQYAAVMSIAAGQPATEMFVQHASGDAMPDGVAISLEGATWKANTTNGDSAIALTFVAA